jgi:hypothetical protein
MVRAVALALVVTLLGPAWANVSAVPKRVVLLGVAGSVRAERDLARVLRGAGEVITQREYIQVAAQIGATTTSPDDVVRVASRLHASAVVAGKIERDGRFWSFKVVLREGASGRVIAKLRYPLSRPRLGRQIERQLREDLWPALAATAAPGAAGGAGGAAGAVPADAMNEGGSEDEDYDEDGPIARPNGALRGRATARVSGGARQTLRASALEESDDENPLADDSAPASAPATTRVATRKPAPAAPPPPTDRPVARSVVELALGAGFSARTYVTSNKMEATYSSQQIPSFRIDGAIFPAASLGRVGAAFGIDGYYEHMTSFSSTSDKMPGATATTSEDAFGIGLRLRWLIREDADSPVLGVRIGLGGRHFAIQADMMGADLGIPAVDYEYADLAGLVRIPLGTWRVALAGTVAYQPVFSAGAIVEGSTFGPASVYGVHGEGGLELAPFSWLQLRAGATYSHFAFKFSGNGRRKVDTATDDYLGGYVMLGFIY